MVSTRSKRGQPTNDSVSAPPPPLASPPKINRRRTRSSVLSRHLTTSIADSSTFSSSSGTETPIDSRQSTEEASGSTDDDFEAFVGVRRRRLASSAPSLKLQRKRIKAEDTTISTTGHLSLAKPSSPSTGKVARRETLTAAHERHQDATPKHEKLDGSTLLTSGSRTASPSSSSSSSDVSAFQPILDGLAPGHDSELETQTLVADSDGPATLSLGSPTASSSSPALSSYSSSSSVSSSVKAIKPEDGDILSEHGSELELQPLARETDGLYEPGIDSDRVDELDTSDESEEEVPPAAPIRRNRNGRPRLSWVSEYAQVFKVLIFNA